MVARSTLAAIHIAKKDLNLHDDDYRAMLREQGKVDSAADLDEAGARRVMVWFENKGFKGTSGRKGTAGDRRPIVRKARALWISLYQLDEVRRRKDSALDAFAKSLTNKETLRFCTNGEAAKVVEALKSWCRRVGVTADSSEAVVQEQLRRLTAHAERLIAHPAQIDRVGVGDIIVQLQATHPNWRQLADTAGAAIRRLKLGRRHQSPSQTEGA